MLGRPLHLFDHVAQQLAHQITHRLQHSGHRSVCITLTHAQWQPLRTTQQPKVSTVSIARASVLALMDARYGFKSSTSDSAGLTLPPVSATEQRIGAHAQAVVLQALEDILPAAPEPESAPTTSTQPWQWQALIEIEGLGAHPIGIALDARHSLCLEQRIQALRQAQSGTQRHTPAAAAPLQVQVVARVVEKTVTAADIYQLRPGSVLPIAVGRATVLLNDSAMLTASVAEHKGKLHLTAFENLE